MMSSPEMDEGADSESDAEDQSESSEIPASLVDGTPQPGQTINLTVVSVNADGGTITVTKPESDEEPSGSDQMASEFDNQPSTNT
jgi:hypothetical protein